MGGYGSTRWRWEATRRTTDELLNLDVRQVDRAGLFNKGSYPWPWSWWQGEERIASIRIRAPYCEPPFVMLQYQVNDPEEGRSSVEQSVGLEWTPCHFGGERPWWLCPVCGRRCAILYAGHRFLCRLCQNLAYPVEREGRPDRLLRRANKVRARLTGSTAGLLDFPAYPDRPKGMHRRTYRRLVEREQRLRDLALITFTREHGVLALSSREERLLVCLEAEV